MCYGVLFAGVLGSSEQMTECVSMCVCVYLYMYGECVNVCSPQFV